MNSSRQRVDISRVASIAALAIALLIVALLLWRTWQSAQFSAGIFGYPFQVDESEGMIAAETLLLDQGQNIYNFPGPQQFVAAPYPPLYYLLNLPLIHFTGYSLKVGRTLTILSTLAAAALLFALVKLATRRRLAAIIAALAFLASLLGCNRQARSARNGLCPARSLSSRVEYRRAAGRATACPYECRFGSCATS